MLKAISIATLLLLAAGPLCADEAQPASTPPAQKPALCTAQTGTRIQSRDARCQATASRSYTQKDLQRTGEFTTAGALRKLDPAVR